MTGIVRVARHDIRSHTRSGWFRNWAISSRQHCTQVYEDEWTSRVSLEHDNSFHDSFFKHGWRVGCCPPVSLRRPISGWSRPKVPSCPVSHHALRSCSVISSHYRSIFTDLCWLLGVGCFRHWDHHNRFTVTKSRKSSPSGPSWSVAHWHMVYCDRCARFHHGRLVKVIFLLNFGGSSFSTGTLSLSKTHVLSFHLFLVVCV